MYLGGGGGASRVWVIGASLGKPHIGELSITRVCVSSGGGGVADLARARKHLRYEHSGCSVKCCVILFNIAPYHAEMCLIVVK